MSSSSFARRSTLDLFQRGRVPLADDERWRAAAPGTGAQLGTVPQCLRVGAELRAPDEEALRHAFGLRPGGASLIRPEVSSATRRASRHHGHTWCNP